ncbi:hypothetical protein TraAM80_09872 [Trypanosoma rangeli]|uniref:Uncharacterized protein n=1 Tax=Trypanosoma rangeli TaxID=5698 RepID=A0A422MSY5_TRYRA|nr:uncharacterized protein TraAM80_09872 [Trypanosoma rangeli]RNE96310.1 hypothetical protein TraAM80_09872 [Trypanosoma rangeli]|eukprot:RNE96310.1 hypothetical protein TraAM80_09872 [Trypanosoma rangeli]
MPRSCYTLFCVQSSCCVRRCTFIGSVICRYSTVPVTKLQMHRLASTPQCREALPDLVFRTVGLTGWAFVAGSQKGLTICNHAWCFVIVLGAENDQFVEGQKQQRTRFRPVVVRAYAAVNADILYNPRAV